MHQLSQSFAATAAIVIFVGAVTNGCDAGSSSSTTTSGNGTGAGAGSGSGGSGTGQTTGTGTGSGGGSTGSGMVEPLDLIDDLEDGDPLILAKNGRVGAWYIYNDETMGATQTPDAEDPFLPEMGGPDSSLNYARTTGNGFTDWGAGFGFDLNNPGDGMGGAGIKSPWDGSAYQGIVFWAKGNIPSMRVKVVTEAVVSTAEGGLCELMCDDTFGSIVALSPEWTQYSVSFNVLAQEGWGTAATFDASTLMGIQFQIGANQDFDVAIDEVGFY